MNSLKIWLIPILSAVVLVSCLKDTPFLDVSNTQPIIEFAYGTNGASDLGNFGMDPTAAQLDTAIAVNIASPQVLDYPVKVTLKVDPSFLTKYNAVAGNTPLSILPDSAFKYSTTTVTIQPGYRIARLPLTLYPTKIDPTKSYALPISIVSATGPSGQNLIVSGNAGVAFYAFIGNPIAGAYTREWIRYNAATPTGTPAFDQTTTTLFSAINPTTISVESGTGVTYLVSFTNTNGVPGDFKVTLDAASVTAAGITISGGPTVVLADPVTKKYEFHYTYVNSAGAARYIIDKFSK